MEAHKGLEYQAAGLVSQGRGEDLSDLTFLLDILQTLRPVTLLAFSSLALKASIP